MKTDDLLRTLAADSTPRRPLRMTLLLGLVPGVALAVLAVFLVLGFRADLMESLGRPLSVARFVISGLLGLLALRLVLVLAQPGQRLALWPLAMVALAAATLLGLALWQTPVEARQMALMGKTVSTCLVAIPLLALVPLVAVMATLRSGAPTQPRLASAVAGLAGGGVAAAVYALHCIEDSPLFYVTWYGLAIAIVTALATLVGPRLIRW
ncbi:MAG: DUF1109 domain-containing protein [Rhodobacteraceae bacterium]|jgi:hypothetical protein|nr:DUF1109 domain-containing protein [Paracoccaceae bacterium]